MVTKTCVFLGWNGMSEGIRRFLLGRRQKPFFRDNRTMPTSGLDDKAAERQRRWGVSCFGRLSICRAVMKRGASGRRCC